MPSAPGAATRPRQPPLGLCARSASRPGQRPGASGQSITQQCCGACVVCWPFPRMPGNGPLGVCGWCGMFGSAGWRSQPSQSAREVGKSGPCRLPPTSLPPVELVLEMVCAASAAHGMNSKPGDPDNSGHSPPLSTGRPGHACRPRQGDLQDGRRPRHRRCLTGRRLSHAVAGGRGRCGGLSLPGPTAAASPRRPRRCGDND